MTKNSFPYKLIKGRITETVFEQMMQDTGKFSILPFGYEKTLPTLMNKQKDIQGNEAMDIIRRAPDFAVIENITHKVFLIEVKYLSTPNENTILDYATKIFDTWKPAYLFLATPNGFYFNKASDVVANNGRIDKLDDNDVPQTLQEEYLSLLNEFIKYKESSESE
jgi:hypothetical protein